MAIRFIRQPSETPNITNSDDARLFRYAVGGYNGYIKNYGFELDHEVDGATFRIKKGIAILHGYEIEVDANGWQMTIDNSPTLRYYIVYCEVNLVTQTVEIKSAYDTAWYPAISYGDDLTTHSDGIARMRLYGFQAKNGVISVVQKVIGAINFARNGYSRVPSEGAHRVSTDLSLVGNGASVVGVATTIPVGWYEVELAGGGGGGSGFAAGGAGGYTTGKFFVPYRAGLKLFAGGGGGGISSNLATGGGGGGSVLDIPELGVLLIATGGGGGGASFSAITGGGGGGYGAGGGTDAFGGGGGGYAGAMGRSGGGSGGGQRGGFEVIIPDKGAYLFGGGRGGGAGGNGGINGINGGIGSAGGNNKDASLGGGGNGGAIGGANGGNGYARIYKLEIPD